MVLVSSVLGTLKHDDSRGLLMVDTKVKDAQQGGEAAVALGYGGFRK